MTGLGQFYCNRLPKAIALLLWYFAVILKSSLGLAAYHTLLDQFDQVHQIVDYQWLLLWPSLFVFGIVDAYDEAVQQNHLSDLAFRHRLDPYIRKYGASAGISSLPHKDSEELRRCLAPAQI